jgi:hypothetical protein
MRDAARLMAKVFAVVFGAGSAVVVLLYIMLGAYYLYGRIDRSYRAPIQTAKSDDQAGTFIETYDAKSFPAGFIPDSVPKAELDCEANGPWLKYSGKVAMCSVLIGGRLTAFISRDEVKSNLAGWMTVNPPANSH